MKRNAGLRFMGGVYVFPGGSVAASDGDPALEKQLAHGALPWDELGDSARDRAFAIAAIRETLEEAGLLLGTEDAVLEAARLRALRAQLASGIDFGALLSLSRLTLDLSQLAPLVRWVTPLSEPIRFDTRFYVARLPAGQIAEPDTRESVDLKWLSPRAALAQTESGSMRLAPPTHRTLHELQDIESVTALRAHARAARPATVEPVLCEIDGARWVLFPGDPQHPVRDRVLRGPTRVRL